MAHEAHNTLVTVYISIFPCFSHHLEEAVAKLANCGSTRHNVLSSSCCIWIFTFNIYLHSSSHQYELSQQYHLAWDTILYFSSMYSYQCIFYIHIDVYTDIYYTCMYTTLTNIMPYLTFSKGFCLFQNKI